MKLLRFSQPDGSVVAFVPEAVAVVVTLPATENTCSRAYLTLISGKEVCLHDPDPELLDLIDEALDEGCCGHCDDDEEEWGDY